MKISYLRAGLSALPFVGCALSSAYSKQDVLNIKAARSWISDRGASEYTRKWFENRMIYNRWTLVGSFLSIASVVALVAFKVLTAMQALALGILYSATALLNARSICRDSSLINKYREELHVD